MNLILIGKHLHNETWEKNQLDIPLFERLGDASNNLLIISQGLVKKRTVVKKNNISLILFPKRKLGDYFFFIICTIFEVIVIQKKIRWNVLSASEPIGGGISTVIINWLREIPFIAMVQGDILDLPTNHFSPLKRFILKYITLFVAKRATIVRSVSKKIKKDLILNGIKDNKVLTLRNRVDLERFNSKKLYKTRNKLRKELNWENSKILVYAGGLTKEKGIIEFVYACLKLFPIFPKLNVVIIGDGHLKSWCKKNLNLYSKRVHFTGFVSHHKIQNWLSVGDIYAFCSHHEGMPRVVLEYMSMGKPVISTNVGGVSEVIKDGENGILINTADEEDLFKKIQMVMNINFRNNKFGNKARKTVENFHDMEKTINDQILIYKKIARAS